MTKTEQLQEEKNQFKVGDVVIFSYRDKYDREDGHGVIVPHEDNKGDTLRVCLITRSLGAWGWTNYEATTPTSRLKATGKTMKDFGLSF